jgi:enediyne polyketide synthase
VGRGATLGDMHEETVTPSGAVPAPAGTRTAVRLGNSQDSELLPVDGENTVQLRGRVTALAELTGRTALADFAALTSMLHRQLAGRPARAAVVATSPEQACERLARLGAALDDGASTAINGAAGIFLGQARDTPSIGYLFPGQGSGQGDDGGALARRFETVSDLYQALTLPTCDDPNATIAAQPRITRSSVAGLRALSLLGIRAVAAAGHSLGELSALHWAGAMSEAELFELAAERGAIMTRASEGGGAMAGINAGPDVVQALLGDEPVVIAGYNGPGQTVVSGPAEAVERVRQSAAASNLKTAKVRVSHAFHSPAVAPAAAELDRYLASRPFRPLAGCVVSTVTGDVLPADTDLRQLLVRQVSEPVRFSQALSRMAPGLDLLIEVGPGRVLSGLAAKIAPDVPVIPLGADSPSLSGVLSAAAAAYVLGVSVRHDLLVAGH